MTISTPLATASDDVLTELIVPEETPVGCGSAVAVPLLLGSTRVDDGVAVGAGPPVV